MISVQRSENAFFVGSDRKYFQLCGPRGPVLGLSSCPENTADLYVRGCAVFPSSLIDKKWQWARFGTWAVVPSPVSQILLLLIWFSGCVSFQKQYVLMGKEYSQPGEYKVKRRESLASSLLRGDRVTHRPPSGKEPRSPSYNRTPAVNFPD